MMYTIQLQIHTSYTYTLGARQHPDAQRTVMDNLSFIYSAMCRLLGARQVRSCNHHVELVQLSSILFLSMMQPTQIVYNIGVHSLQTIKKRYLQVRIEGNNSCSGWGVSRGCHCVWSTVTKVPQSAATAEGGLIRFFT